MVQNVGVADKAVRFILGMLLLSLAFVGPQTPWGFLGLIFISTALLNYCPLYTLLKINTCPVKPK